MARKFITSRELNFIHAINDELIQGVVGQEVSYYAISDDKSRAHSLYNEAVEKVWDPPVLVNARVLWDNMNTTFTNFSADSKFSLEVYFHARELSERNVKPREGDFVEFAETFFEITSVTQPQLVYGQANDKIMTKCVCIPSREGQFQAGSRKSEGVSNTHPVVASEWDDDPPGGI